MVKGGGAETSAAGFKTAMKAHREGLNLIIIRKVKGKQMELYQLHLDETKGVLSHWS